MLPLLIPILAGAAIGAMSNKDNRMKGAMMGAGIGATGLLGGAAMGATGAAGAAGTAATGAGATGATGLLGASAAPVTDAAFSAGAGGSTSGLGAGVQGGGLLSTVKEYTPMLNAASTGMQMANSMKPDPVQTSPIMQNGTGPQALQNLASSLDQRTQMELQQAEQERMRRRMALRGY